MNYGVAGQGSPVVLVHGFGELLATRGGGGTEFSGDQPRTCSLFIDTPPNQFLSMASLHPFMFPTLFSTLEPAAFGPSTFTVISPGRVTGGSAGHFRNLIAQLADTHTVYSIDLLGFGESDKPSEADYSPHLWADSVVGECLFGSKWDVVEPLIRNDGVGTG